MCTTTVYVHQVALTATTMFILRAQSDAKTVLRDLAANSQNSITAFCRDTVDVYASFEILMVLYCIGHGKRLCKNIAKHVI